MELREYYRCQYAASVLPPRRWRLYSAVAWKRRRQRDQGQEVRSNT